MDVLQAIKKRYSVRAYKPNAVEDEKLSTILEAARLAPTANNRQPFQIIVIHTDGRIKELLSIYEKTWFVQAPIILCVCGLPNQAWVGKDGRQYYYVDIAIVTDHMVLAATKLGLGTCFIADFNEENARNVLKIPAEVEVILFTPLGYPADRPKTKLRKDKQDLVRYEHW